MAAGALGAVVVVIVGLALAGIGPLAGQRIDVRGTISLPTSTASSAACQGEDEWADVREGTSVTVTNVDGDKLATGRVGAGRRGPSGRGCLFTFDVKVPVGQGPYRLAVGSHDVQPDLSEAALKLEIGISGGAGDLVAVPHEPWA
jgi:hypothetical protein